MKVQTSVLVAVVLAATAFPTGAEAQDELDNLSKSLSAPTPAPVKVAATPKPTPNAPTDAPASVSRPVTATPQPRTATPPKPVPQPREETKPDLSHARFVDENDLSAMAGKKVPGGTYLVGTYKANGEKAGERYVFTTRVGIPILGVVRGSTQILVRFPHAPNPQLLAEGNSSQWTKSTPLRVERVEQTPQGVVDYASNLH